MKLHKEFKVKRPQNVPDKHSAIIDIYTVFLLQEIMNSTFQARTFDASKESGRTKQMNPQL